MIKEYYQLRFLPYIFFYIIINIIVRISIIIVDYSNIASHSKDIIQALSVGIFNDIGICVYCAVLLLGIDLILNKKISRKSIDAIQMFLIFNFSIIFGIIEFEFWVVFGDRPNFIAIDNVFYTHNFMQNLFRYYPAWIILIFSSIICFYTTSNILKHFNKNRINCVPIKYRLRAFGISIILSILLLIAEFHNFDNISKNYILNEISNNGIHHIVESYFVSELPFNRFYPNIEDDQAIKIIQKELKIQKPLNSYIERFIANPRNSKKYNVIFIIVSNLGSDMLHRTYNNEPITPNLNKIAQRSIYSENMTAVSPIIEEGIAALMLSIPPTSGAPLIKTKAILPNIGGILKDQGYQIKYISGNYSYLSKISDFFEVNGYTNISYRDFNERNLQFVNHWGISDEDLLERVLSESEKSYLENKPFFNVVFSSSNHSPYTYPEGKIDIPSKTGKEGAMKYTDYAIGEFIKKAQTKEWFNNTIFVITSANAAINPRKLILDPKKYNIPLLIYSPATISFKQINTHFSQIDAAPTILHLLGISYNSSFFGQNIMQKNIKERAFIISHQHLIYTENNQLVSIKPKKIIKFLKKNVENGSGTEPQYKEYFTTDDNPIVLKAISYFQVSAKYLDK